MFNNQLSVICGCNNSGKTSTLYTISEGLNTNKSVAWIYFSRITSSNYNYKKVSKYSFMIESYGYGEIEIRRMGNDVKTIEVIREYIQRGDIDYLIIDDFDSINTLFQKDILELPVKKIISINHNINGYDENINTCKNISLIKDREYYYLTMYDNWMTKTITINGEILPLDGYLKSLKREAKLNNLLNGKEEY